MKSYGSRAADADTQRNSPEWFQLVWVKTLIAHSIIKKNYNVLFAGEGMVCVHGTAPVGRRGCQASGA
jgi:hypothetical protein